jgi:hypothetical protein
LTGSAGHPDTPDVYAAQSEAADFFLGHGTIADPAIPLQEEKVESFVRSVLDSLGETARALPIVECGSTGHDALAGKYDYERDVILLDTFELNRWRVLHEMAHWLDPKARSGDPDHGPIFRILFHALISAGLGEEAGSKLAEMFAEFGVPLGDQNWQEVIAPL